MEVRAQRGQPDAGSGQVRARGGRTASNSIEVSAKRWTAGRRRAPSMFVRGKDTNHLRVPASSVFPLLVLIALLFNFSGREIGIDLDLCLFCIR